MQSSTKQFNDIKKYFVYFDENNSETFESLKNVFSSIGDESFIELETIDNNSVTTKLKISILSANTNTANDVTIALANASSDFIHYKLLYNLFNVSHKFELNLWKVFMRDIFPYFRKTETVSYYKNRINDILKGVPMSSGGVRVAKKGGRIQIAYVDKITKLNSDIQLFISEIEQNANDFLQEHFYDGKNDIQINIDYRDKINYDTVRDNIKDKYVITLYVKIWDRGYFGLSVPPFSVQMMPLTFLSLGLLKDHLQS